MSVCDLRKQNPRHFSACISMLEQGSITKSFFRGTNLAVQCAAKHIMLYKLVLDGQLLFPVKFLTQKESGCADSGHVRRFLGPLESRQPKTSLMVEKRAVRLGENLLALLPTLVITANAQYFKVNDS
jgi:hypothetical protein